MKLIFFQRILIPNIKMQIWKKIAGNIKLQIYTLYLVYKDERTPCYIKVFSICIISYFLSPIDIIPDFIPVIGYIDDIIILPIAIYFVLRMIPDEVLNDCKEKAKNTNIKIDGKIWLGFAIVIINWVFILLFALYLIKIIFLQN